MDKFRQFFEFTISMANDNESLQPGMSIGFRVQNNTSQVHKTTGHTATEGEGYYVCKTFEMAQSLQKIGWGSDIVKVKFRTPQKMIQADTLPILNAWQNHDETLFEPIGPSDSFWTKINKMAARKVGANPQNLHQVIDTLVFQLTKDLKKTGADSVFVKNPGFVVLLY